MEPDGEGEISESDGADETAEIDVDDGTAGPVEGGSDCGDEADSFAAVSAADNRSGGSKKNGKGRKNKENHGKKAASEEETQPRELLEHIKELEAGVEDQEEDYDIEREIQPEKIKSTRKGKARKKKKS